MADACVLVAESGDAKSPGMAKALAGEKVDLLRADSADKALEVLRKQPVDVLVVDDGLEGGAVALLQRLIDGDEQVSFVVAATERRVAELESLAADALEIVKKPVDAEELRFAVRKALTVAERLGAAPPSLSLSGKELIGSSRVMEGVHDLIRRAATGTATVLIRGESGTGKELVAREIHQRSPRAGQRFHKLDCTSLPESLLESELFGHERGAFTGAIATKKGRVEMADGGTLFLDEIGEVTPALQAKMLRLLQEREFERVGGNETRKIDVRFVAATHRDLEAMVKQGTFRADLFYRLNVVPIWLPPLRARREDIDQLAHHFCKRLAQANGKPAMQLDPGALPPLRAHRWPGNVRQLENFIERLVVLSDGPRITLDDVQRVLSQQEVQFATQSIPSSRMAAPQPAPGTVGDLEERIRVAEKKALSEALAAAKGSRTQAARILGISRATLYNKMKEHAMLGQDAADKPGR